jgi:hypothetical protein
MHRDISQPWPCPCRSLPSITFPQRSPTIGLMNGSSPALCALRSTISSAFLAAFLLGCGSGSSGAVAQQTVQEQDWEVQPSLWSPRAILIPRSTPPATASALPDSMRTVTLQSTLHPDSSTPVLAVAIPIVGHSKIPPTPGDSALPDSLRSAPKSAGTPKAKPKRSAFNISPSDSAKWPVKAPPPLPESLIPEHRIVAFYGNPLSKRMGILGELPPEQMLARLEEVATQWAAADSGQKVLPALHLIATVAQGYPGPTRKYRLQMADSVIERMANWAEEKGWILFLDIQVGVSTVEDELRVLVPYLKRPYVHLALDPEFAMKDGKRPGTDWMGRMDASEVNHAIGVLAEIVEQHGLPPKVLVVHRFTRNMLTNASQIRLDPRVQVVIDMDGWGSPGSKMGAYRWFVVRHPVQYTGFKLFYKNDKPMMTPEQVLELYPKPMYIQYQ